MVGVFDPDCAFAVKFEANRPYTSCLQILSFGYITPAWIESGRCGKIIMITTGFATHVTFVGRTLVATWIDLWLLSMKEDEESILIDPVEIDPQRHASCLSMSITLIRGLMCSMSMIRLRDYFAKLLVGSGTEVTTRIGFHLRKDGYRMCVQMARGKKRKL